MDNLRKGIKIYFSKWDSESLIYLKSNIHLNNNIFSQETFSSFAKGSTLFDLHTNSDIDSVYRKLTEDWMYHPKKNGQAQSPFYLLSHFTKQVLIEREIEPFIVHHHLLKWRDLTMDLGEDIFTTSYLALKDISARRNRENFSWRPTLFSDNYRLHQVLQEGVAENHSHLWASSLTFDMSWMALMNRYNIIEKDFIKFLKTAPLNKKYSFEFKTKAVDYEILIKKAITIRLLLQLLIDKRIQYPNLTEIDKNSNSYIQKLISGDLKSLFQASNNEDSIELLTNFQEVLQSIELLGTYRGLKLNHDRGYQFFDYAADANMHSDNINKCFYLYGERYLMYQTFQEIYQSLENNTDSRILEILFHKYLLIKNQFRQELILLNKRPGFENFKQYQDRKFTFIPSYSIYSVIFLRITLNYNRRIMNIISNEYRIGPETSIIRWKKSINEILKQRLKHKDEIKLVQGYQQKYLLDRIEGQKTINKKSDIHFVVHFFKFLDTNFLKQNETKESDIYTKQLVQSRDHYLRKEVKKGAKKIVEFREQDSKLSRRITGIDAASSELVSRPEAFGQAFRYLKHHQTRVKDPSFKDKIYNNQLRITFHAGEDFYDIVDGMRYIDESIRFLNMGQGDRFGHALAIGIDIQDYYAKKQNKIMLSKHTLLDNVTWLLSKVRKFGLNQHMNEVARLENKFTHLFSEIYLNSGVDNSLRTIDFSKYYDAWKLRGDAPCIYYEVITKFDKNKKSLDTLESYFKSVLSLSYWDKCRLNDFYPKLNNIRGRYEISRLYYEYHFNPNVKNKGHEITQFEITRAYMKLVEDVQKAMMFYIEERNIAIETNPTSNFLIGPINRYIEHPILKWFNLGLYHDENLLKNSPQLSVSINTDDAGIFSTSLENEYALLAIALEKEKDELGNPLYSNSIIYDWIDKIRKMGLEQSFNRIKNKN